MNLSLLFFLTGILGFVLNRKNISGILSRKIGIKRPHWITIRHSFILTTTILALVFFDLEAKNILITIKLLMTLGTLVTFYCFLTIGMFAILWSFGNILLKLRGSLTMKFKQCI